MEQSWIRDVSANTINSTQAYFEIVTEDGRKFGIDVNLYPTDDGKLGFYSRFNVSPQCTALVEAHHFDDVETLLRPLRVKNQSQQVEYTHSEVMPPPPEFSPARGHRRFTRRYDDARI